MKNEKKAKVSKAGAYLRGAYVKTMEFVSAKGTVTRSMVVDALQKLGKKVSAAQATATVILSPRESDSLGNGSADGVHYYMIPLKAKSESGEKQFRLHVCNKAEVEARQKLADKRALPKCRAKAEAKAEKVRALKAERKAKAEEKAALKATAKMVKDKAKAKTAPAKAKAKAVKAPKSVEQMKVAPVEPAPAPAVAEVAAPAVAPAVAVAVATPDTPAN